MMPMPCVGLMGSIGSLALPIEVQVANLFASFSGPKLWLDPSDTSTRFQDYSATIPATTDGQIFARLNDKSGAANHVGQVAPGSEPIWKTAGGLSWAQPDGVNDSWQSLVNFDCSSTDKITVVAGLRKESDAAIAAFMELGANSSAVDGTIGILAPRTAAASNIQYLARGTALDAMSQSASAPVTGVLSGRTDIGAAFTQERWNGAVSQTGGAFLGTGSFISALLNLFRRNNATLPFGGRMYGLMIFGRLLTADELSLCETYMAQKTGIVF